MSKWRRLLASSKPDAEKDAGMASMRDEAGDGIRCERAAEEVAGPTTELATDIASCRLPQGTAAALLWWRCAI